MPSSAESSAAVRSTVLPGPTLIAAGLAVLIATAWWPAMPVATGMALVALGATGALITRLHGSGILPTAMTAHLFVYVSLYLVLIGAVTHSAMVGPQNGLSFLQGLDFGVSAGLMTMAVRITLAAIGGEDAPAR